MLVVARYLGAVAAGCCLALSAHAQTPGAQSAPTTDNTTDASGADAQAQQAPAAEDERRLDLLNFSIEGNTVLSRIEIEEAVLPFLGPQRKVSDVEAARLALMRAYHAKGYETVDVRIPAQDVRNGNIKFEVVELTVGRLRVDGSRYFSPEDIKARVPSLAEGAVPNYKNVAIEIADVNKSADRLITPTLRAGAAPGTVDVDLHVEDQIPLHGSIEANDRASNRTKRARLAGGVSYTNLFQREHSVNLQVQLTPEKPEESWVASASYVAPLADTPFTFVGYVVHSDSDVAAIGGINVLGSGDIVGLRGIYTNVGAVKNATVVHQITAGIDYKSFKEDLVVGSDRGRTPIDYMPLTLQYSQARRAKSYDFDFGVGVNIGIRGLDATNEEFENKRFGAKANWAVLSGNAAYTYKFENDWRLGGRVSGQFAGKPVISNEQFAGGGLESVRGYYESQELGDDGVSIQLQLDTPSFHGAIGSWFDDARLFAFADGADLRTYEPIGEQGKYASLASVGAGLQLRVNKTINASFLLATPLIEPKSTLTDFGNVRVQARLWAEF